MWVHCFHYYHEEARVFVKVWSQKNSVCPFLLILPMWVNINNEKSNISLKVFSNASYVINCYSTLPRTSITILASLRTSWQYSLPSILPRLLLRGAETWQVWDFPEYHLCTLYCHTWWKFTTELEKKCSQVQICMPITNVLVKNLTWSKLSNYVKGWWGKIKDLYPSMGILFTLSINLSLGPLSVISFFHP